MVSGDWSGFDVNGKTVTLFDDVSTSILTSNLKSTGRVIVKVLISPELARNHCKYMKKFRFARRISWERLKRSQSRNEL